MAKLGFWSRLALGSRLRRTYWYLTNSVPELITISAKTVAKNAGALYAIQFAQLAMPLATVPYVLRILGPSGFGQVGFATGLTAYFTLAVDYGFSLSATRAVSLNRNDAAQVNEIYSNTIYTKATLFTFGALVVWLLTAVSPKIHSYDLIIAAAYLAIVGNVISPIWLYQGMERMGFLAVSNVLTQLLVTGAIFLVIRRPGDAVLYALILSSGQVLNGLLTLIRGQSLFNVRLVRPRLAGIISSLRDGWTLFLSSASVSLYTAGNSFILGFFASSSQVGYFAAAEKLTRAAQALLGPISQAAYPRFAQLAVESREGFTRWVKRLFVAMGAFGFLISLAMFLLSSLAVRLLLGSNFAEAATLIRVMAIIPFLVSFNTVLGAQVMLPLGKDKPFTIILLSGGLINFLAVLIFVPHLAALGSAVALVIAELVVTVSMFVYVLRLMRQSADQVTASQ